jgi:hypothetical protein
MLLVHVAFIRDDRWFGRAVPRRIWIVLLSQTGGPKIPVIRRASGPMSLFDSQEGRPGPGMEEAAVVKRPLLYVRGSLSSPHNVSHEDGWASRILRTQLRFHRFTPNQRDPYNLVVERRVPWGTMTTTRITLGNPSAHRMIIVPGTVGFLKHTNPFITPIHAAQRSTHKTQCPFTTTTRPSRHERR